MQPVHAVVSGPVACNDRWRLAARGVALFLTALAWLSSIGLGQAQTTTGVISDNYRGLNNVPSGLSGPAYANQTSTSNPNALNTLKTFAANPANIQTTETLSTLNISESNYGLCNNYIAAGQTQTSCVRGWQGRVMYTLIKFPTTGTYTFTAAHDDQVQLDLSTQFATTDFRNAVYTTSVGNLAAFTTNENTYETVGNFAVSATGCYLMRIYWNNEGGRSFFRLRYGTSGPSSGQTIVPASQLLLPGVPANWASCTNSPASVTVIKRSVGDTGSFSFSGNNGYPGETISTGSTNPAAGSTFSLTSLGTATTLTETVPSGYTLTSASCVDTNAANTTNPTGSFGTLSGNTLTIPAVNVKAAALLRCTFENTKLPTLGLSKTSNGPWSIGQSGANYALTVSNTNTAGGQSSTGTITVRDTLPSAVTANWSGTLTTGGFSCTASGQSVTCQGSAVLTPGASSTLTLPVTVVSGAGSTATNFASVGGGGDPRNGGAAPTPGAGCTPTGLCASTATVILAAPTIAKAFAPTSVPLNETTTLTFTLTNPNSSALSALSFTDGLSGMNVASSTLGGTCAGTTASPALNVADTSLTLGVPSLAAGSSCTITVSVRGTVVGNNPNVTSGVTSTQTPTAGAVSNTATLTVTPSANLSISKTGPSTAVAGTTITYLLTLRNDGPSAADGATFADNLPNTLTGVTAVCQNALGGASGCSTSIGSGNNLTGSVATFPVNATIEVLITATIPPGTTTALNNFATIAAPTGTTDPNTSNNTSATVTTTVNRVANLSVTKTNGVTTVIPGQTVTYTIVLANTGPSTTTTSFRDNTFSGMTLSNWTCSVTSGTASCPGSLPTSGGLTPTLINMPAGSILTFQVTGTVTAISGTVSNTASAPSPSNNNDPDPSNNAATDTDAVATTDLSLTKTGPAAAHPGSLVRYTLSVSNAGPGPASSVTLTDPLPPGTTFSLGDQDPGFSGTYDSSTRTVTWALGTLAASASSNVTLRLTLPAADAVRGNPAATPPLAPVLQVTNTASVATSSAETDTTNNSATLLTGLILSELTKSVRNVSTGSPAGTAASGQPRDILEYCVVFRNLGGVDLPAFTLTDAAPQNVTPLTDAYDAAEPSAATGFGIKLTRGGLLSYLTSATDSPTPDAGTLTTSGSTFGQGALTLALGLLQSGETGQVCFQTRIR